MTLAVNVAGLIVIQQDDLSIQQDGMLLSDEPGHA
jgi:hypothetical protein